MFAYGIREVASREVVNCQTYNIEVADDESYSAAGLVSHNCKIAKDICSACGNEARNRTEYCDADTCPAGGCKHNLGAVVKLGNRVHHLHVDNPAPLRWFDLTCVTNDRQADRIALGVAADWAKAATNVPGRVIGGAELAEAAGVGEPWSMAALGMQKLAAGLASISLEPAFLPGLSCRPRIRLSVDDPLFSEKLAALADLGVILSPAEFSALVGHNVKRASDIDYRYVVDADIRNLIENNPLVPVGVEPSPAAIAFAATKQAASCAADVLLSTARQAAIRGTSVSPVVGGDGDVAATRMYALYKTAALWRYTVAAGDRVSQRDYGLTARAVRAQDWLEDQQS